MRYKKYGKDFILGKKISRSKMKCKKFWEQNVLHGKTYYLENAIGCYVRDLPNIISKQYLKKQEKNPMLSWLPFFKLKELLAPEISKFTKIRRFQKNLYANFGSLNDYELIISIKINKKVFVCLCFIFKIRDITSTQICFSISVHALKWESRFVCLQRLQFQK